MYSKKFDQNFHKKKTSFTNKKENIVYAIHAEEDHQPSKIEMKIQT